MLRILLLCFSFNWFGYGYLRFLDPKMRQRRSILKLNSNDDLMPENIVFDSEMNLFEKLDLFDQQLSWLLEKKISDFAKSKHGTDFVKAAQYESLFDLFSPLMSGRVRGDPSAEGSKCCLMMARRLAPLVPLYFKSVQSFLKLNTSENDPRKVFKLMINEVQKLNNKTYELKLIRLRKAIALVDNPNPSDDELSCLRTSDGLGITLACAAVLAEEWQRKQLLDKKADDEVDFERFFAEGINNPFLDLNDEVEVNLRGRCDFFAPASVLMITAGEIVTRADSLADIKKRLSLSLGLIEWAARCCLSPKSGSISCSKTAYVYISKAVDIDIEDDEALTSGMHDNIDYVVERV